MCVLLQHRFSLSKCIIESSWCCFSKTMSLKNVMRLCPSIKACFNNSSLLHLSEGNAGLSNGIRPFHIYSALLKKQEVTIIFEKGGNEITAKGKEGDSILDVVQNNNLELTGFGACEGTLSCSTCHVILSQENFSMIPESASDEELDMLDLAPDVCGTSRLGCQVYLSKNIDGLRVKVPEEIKDQRNYPGATSSIKS